MKKVQAALGNIMNLDSAAITVNDRLTALRITHSQRLSAKVPSLSQPANVISSFAFALSNTTLSVVNWSTKFSG